MATKKSKSASTKTAKAAKPAVERKARTNTKASQVLELLRRPKGATIDELAKAVGWQVHSVRGLMSGSLKKKQGLAVKSEKIEGRGRVYSLPAQG